VAVVDQELLVVVQVEPAEVAPAEELVVRVALER
jgi:hypothetical protein